MSESKEGPNQPHLSTKYQINMGFHIFMESGLNIFVRYEIDVVK